MDVSPLLGGGGASGSGGETGACDDDEKLCDGECVSIADSLAEKASLEIRLADKESDPPRIPVPPARGRESGCEVLHVLSKSDRPGLGRGHSLRERYLFLSALRGTGVKRLLAAMRARLGIARLRRRTGPILVNERQARLVEAAIEAASAGRDRRAVLESLCRYLG